MELRVLGLRTDKKKKGFRFENVQVLFDAK